MSRERIVVICPGRGSYTKETLGYLNRYKPMINDFLSDVDERRQQIGEPTISELDSADKFVTGQHTKGEHASTLIYSCSYADYMAIDQERFEVVAITGNSMGWYITLSLSGVLDWGGSFDVIHTMGSMMKQKIIGGQIIYPIVNEQWQVDPRLVHSIEELVAEVNAEPEHEAYLSIRLGGYYVLAGNNAGLKELSKRLTPMEHYPFNLVNHAAFHTPLLRDITDRALRKIPRALFASPKVPIIDGRGKIWSPYFTDRHDIYDYTFGHQVSEAYDFSAAITVALKEFAPDRLVLLGPGNSLGGSIGQIMIKNDWHKIKSKDDFVAQQKQNPLLVSMGLEDQRALVT